jgi:hypothetical protein
LEDLVEIGLMEAGEVEEARDTILVDTFGKQDVVRSA